MNTMEEEEYLDQARYASEETASNETKKGRRSFAKMRRELSEDEFSSPAVGKLLIDEIERLETDNSSLSDYRDRYYRADKAVGVLQEKQKVQVSGEIIFSVCLTIGAALIGLSASEWSSQPTGWIMVSSGVVLFICGIASKFVKR